MSDFAMPSLGADMAAGTLIEWLVKPGQAVQRGDAVAIVETDKGNIDIEIWQSGVIDELRVPTGTTVPVGTVLATMRDQSTAPAVPPAATPPAPAIAEAPSGPRSSARASPGARQLARQLGIDVSRVHGTGPHGAVTRSDVEKLAATGGMAETTTGKELLVQRPMVESGTGMRRAIAASMSRSKREIPHYYVSESIDVSRLLAWLQRENETRGVAERLLVAAPLVRATALALRKFPELNGHFVDGELRPSESVHLGFAVATKAGGLIAPALHDVERKSVPELMAAIGDLIPRARSGGLRSSELADGTFTLNSLGERGVDVVQGIIYPPQVGLLGLGRIAERPWALDGLLGVRPILTATLAADHRVSDGHRGALFLRAFEELLNQPEQL